MSRAAVASGAAMVADAQITIGVLPCTAARRRRRRMTMATWDPKTPR